MSYTARFLFWSVIIVAVGACSLWILGGKRNEYSTSLTIDADPSTVFSFLTEPDRLKAWGEGLQEVGELISNVNEEGFSKRQKTERVLTRDDRKIHFEDEVLRFNQDDSISVQSTNASLIITSIFTLEPKGEVTHISYRVKTQNRGLGRFTAPFQEVDVQQRIERELGKLKIAIESSPEVSSPEVSSQDKPS